ncbi:hypothetical protein LIA77_01904 [Sarocladium implicatum]|nr:hypothetical protein LIA77_01904 [Sarocladium implicatum]
MVGECKLDARRIHWPKVQRAWAGGFGEQTQVGWRDECTGGDQAKVGARLTLSSVAGWQEVQKHDYSARHDNVDASWCPSTGVGLLVRRWCSQSASEERPRDGGVGKAAVGVWASDVLGIAYMIKSRSDEKSRWRGRLLPCRSTR